MFKTRTHRRMRMLRMQQYSAEPERRRLEAVDGASISAWWATWKFPSVSPRAANVPDDQVTVPAVRCGKGWRQLRWLEEISVGDEYFGGTFEKPTWLPMNSQGGRYRPQIANSAYAPWAIIRRRENDQSDSPEGGTV